MHHVRREAHDGRAAERNAVVDALAPTFDALLKGRADLHIVLFVASPGGYTVASSLPTEARAIGLTKYIVDHHEGRE